MGKPLMIQGTTSDAGKSFITAAICRILKQDGYKVAPFKSQNMALNSFITEEGLEMGRAQVMQAEAAGIKPDVRMNPILLKPMTQMGSQVILNGKPLQNMEAKAYFRYKKELIPHIMEAYTSLANVYDVVVIEGAGSPAEINLRKDDIVNMGMAELVNSPVLLAGDIDRGGVFASLAGTLMLVSEEERARIKGLIINKFRGDIDILQPGIQMIEAIVKVPVVGVVPMLDVDIDDEDSLAVKKNQRVGDLLDIVVIQLPHISNFTDFNALGLVDGVGVRYVRHPKEIRNPDLLIIPGTKNTIGDLAWLRSRGFEAPIARYVARGGAVFGICGGYQMLGKSLSDPYDVECGGTVKGLGFLNTHTVFEKEKHTVQVEGHFGQVEGIFSELTDRVYKGYEIHMGQTTLEASIRHLTQTEGAQQGNVYGTYVHGVFDEQGVTETIIKALLESKGFDANSISAVDMLAYKEQQYDKLGELVRASLNMDFIYEVIEKGMQ